MSTSGSDTESVRYSSDSSSSPCYYTLPPLPPTPPVNTATDADYKLPQLIGSGGDGDASLCNSSSSSSSSNQSSPPHSERTRRDTVHRSRSHSIDRVDANLVSRAAATQSHSAATGPAHRLATGVRPASSNALLPPIPTPPTRTPPPPVSTFTAQPTTAPARVRLQQSASPHPHQHPHQYEEPACSGRGAREADCEGARIRARNFALSVHAILDQPPFTVTVTSTRHVPSARECKTSLLPGADSPRAEARYSRLRSNKTTKYESSEHDYKELYIPEPVLDRMDPQLALDASQLRSPPEEVAQ